jgi:hypothetical protein
MKSASILGSKWCRGAEVIAFAMAAWILMWHIVPWLDAHYILTPPYIRVGRFLRETWPGRPISAYASGLVLLPLMSYLATGVICVFIAARRPLRGWSMLMAIAVIIGGAAYYQGKDVLNAPSMFRKALIVVPRVLQCCMVLVAAMIWTQRASRAGCCEQCGYNLTLNTSGRCPECGGPAGGGAT